MRRRGRRRLRRLAVGLVLALAVLGAVSAYQSLFGAPGVGHFRSDEGRGEYVTAYEEAMSALPDPDAVHDVVTSWGTVRTYEWAPPGSEDTTPVVLVPGRSSGVPMWQANLPGYADERRVLAFDALGDAGLSVQGVPLGSFEDMASWMHEVLAEVAPGGAHVVGHSFGGASAAVYSQQYPDDVVSLTLLDPVFTFAYPPADMMAWTTLASLPGLPDSLRETALGKVGGGDYDEEDPMSRMIAAGAEHYAAALPTPGLVTDEQATRFTMPVYVAIASDDSLAGGQSAADRAKAVLPDGTVETWPNTTHSLPMQVADPLENRLEEFWAEHEV
jgi:pimeloyl-ACP methyl ester carboxylesterase